MSDHPYNDDDFVYVDPQARAVVGKVEWTKDGMPKSRTYTPAVEEKPGRRPRTPKKRTYPWGTWKSMKKVFRIEKSREPEPQTTLEEVLPKAMQDPFWN